MVTDCDIFSANEKQKNEFRHLLGLVSATFRRKVNCQAIVQFKKKKEVLYSTRARFYRSSKKC